MASPCEVLCRDADAQEASRLTQIAADEAWRIEDKFSRYRSDNIVAAINSANSTPTRVDEETGLLLDFSEQLFELSGGRFDITSGVLRRAWRFDGGSRIPSGPAISELVNLVGWDRVSWDGKAILLGQNMEIDFGGIGKEYAADRAAGLLLVASDTSCLINFGGDLAISRSTAGDQAWRVGIASTRRRIQLSAGALATSGDTERFVIRDGIRLGHILNAKTGWPVSGAPRSVTVAAETCTQAGMLSTLAMLQGEGAEAFLAEQGVDYWCLR